MRKIIFLFCLIHVFTLMLINAHKGDRGYYQRAVFLKKGLDEKAARENYGRTRNLRRLPVSEEDLYGVDGKYDFSFKPKR